MRIFIFLQALLAILNATLEAQVPYSTSSVRGSTIITNYYDPNAGPSTGPGLSISPLDYRFNAPLGTPWGVRPATTPAVTATYATTPTSTTSTLVPTSSITSSSASSLLPTSATIPASSSFVPSAGQFPSTPPALAGQRVIPTNYMGARPVEPLMPVPPTQYGQLPQGLPFEPTYLFPGLVRNYMNQWVGNDYLYNAPPGIGVVVEIIQPSDSSQLINTDVIKNNISEIFLASGITPVSESFNDLAPLPFFHLVIFLTPVDDNYVFSIAGRLFETVTLPRLNFKLPGTFQAITWERQEMIITSKNRLEEQALYTAREIADLFTSRLRYYRQQIIEQEEQLKLRCPPAPSAKCLRHKSTF